MDGLELCDRLRPLRDAAADNAYMLGDERERGMYDGYGEVMRRCLELPEADVEDWIYGFTHAIRESGDADTEYARGRGIAMDCVIWSLGPTGREPREAIEKRLGAEDPGWPDGGDHRRRRHRGRPGVRGLAGGPSEGRLRGEGPGMGGPRGSITDVITSSTIL